MDKQIQIYYLRHPDEQPIACVALHVEPDGSVTRGISIWSGLEQFCRAEARKWAIKRCLRASGTGECSDPVGERLPGGGIRRMRAFVAFRRRWSLFHGVEWTPPFKAEPHAIVTPFERALLDKATEKRSKPAAQT